MCIRNEFKLASWLTGLPWALQEEELEAARLWLQDAQALPARLSNMVLLPESEQGQDGVLSQWMLAPLSVDLFRRQVAGQISAVRFRQCLPRLPRFLRGSPRRRTHWYSHTWSWLTSSEASASLSTEVR